MWDGGRVETTKDAAASTGSPSINASATVNVKGSWVQLIGATAFESSWVIVNIVATSTITRYMVDVGIGAAGAEQVLIANIITGGGSTTVVGATFNLPLAIPAGSRIAVRSQAGSASASTRAQIILLQGGPNQPPPLGRCTTWGAVPATTRGAIINTGATINTKGVWTEITASTEHAIRYLRLQVTHGGIVTAAGIHALVDVGIGPAGSEFSIFPDTYWYFSTASDAFITPPICLPVNIPAGVRLAARGQGSLGNTTATDSQYDVILIGVG